MPIRVACQCGHAMNVPDGLAGKSGKCPKCQQVIKIPFGGTASAGAGASGLTSTPNSAATAVAVAKAPTGKGASPKGPQPAVPVSALDGLLEAAGMSERKGKHCPSCDAPVQASAVLCVACGFNLTEGTKTEGYQAVIKRQFGDKRLNEAVDMMAREKATEKRLLDTGFPWWFLFAGLAGLMVFLAGALVKMDASTSGEVSKVPLFARIQAATMLSVLAGSAGLGCTLVANFAHLAILVKSFQESWKQGLLFIFIPLYNLYYMFSRLKSQRLVSTVVLMFVTGILGALLLAYALPKI